MDFQQTPEIFEVQFPVKPGDIDGLHHVNNVVYVRWVVDVSVAHWRAAATVEQQAELYWVVVRHEIDYKRSAVLGDTIVARTWVGTASEKTFERHVELLRAEDRKVLAQARTLWCPMSRTTQKPTRVSAEVRERFSTRATNG
jgi:acyl-CoA thioester hydrolase